MEQHPRTRPMEHITMLVKKTIIILAAIGLFNMFLMNNLVFADTYAVQNSAQQLCTDPSNCRVQSVDDIYRILGKIVGYTYTIFFIVAIFFILLAAFSFLTARGDPQKIISARNQILWASVAIAIALISFSVSIIVKNILGGGGNTIPSGTTAATMQFDKKPYIS